MIFEPHTLIALTDLCTRQAVELLRRTIAALDRFKLTRRLRQDTGVRMINPVNLSAPVGGYSHGMVTGDDLLFISGQTPESSDGSVSPDPEQQLRQVWANVAAVLAAAAVGVSELVHVRTYLADRSHREINAKVRGEILGLHAPALTVVICELFEPGWVAEIEGVAQLPASSRSVGG